MRLLEAGLRATACHILRDGSAETGARAAAGVAVTVDEAGAEMRAHFPTGVSIAEAWVVSGGSGGERGGGSADGGSSGDEGGEGGRKAQAWAHGNGDGISDGGGDGCDGALLRAAVLGSDREAELARALAEQCDAVLAAFPTTAEQDERILSGLAAGFRGGEQESSSPRNDHLEMAVRFRLLRKRLIEKAAEGLRVQAELVECSGRWPT